MEKKETIIIAEYQNYINEDGKPKGHGKKSLEEAYQLLSDGDFEVKCIASKTYCNFKAENAVYLEEIVRSRSNRIKRLHQVFKNISLVFEQSDNKIIWFTNVDWMFLVYIALVHKKRNVVVATIFRDIYEDVNDGKWGALKKILRCLVSRGLGKIDLALVTNPSLTVPFVKEQIHVPDFYYKSEYDKYRKMNKEERIVCLGLMHRDKDIIGVAKHFAGSDISVYIIGDFENQEFYQEVVQYASDNVLIENRTVPETEYLDLIGGSKYVIMPYSVEIYKNATSGILLETIFMNSIPIAPEVVLKNNYINGIGYNHITDIPIDKKLLSEASANVSNSVEMYNQTEIRKRVVGVLMNLL